CALSTVPGSAAFIRNDRTHRSELRRGHHVGTGVAYFSDSSRRHSHAVPFPKALARASANGGSRRRKVADGASNLAQNSPSYIGDYASRPSLRLVVCAFGWTIPPRTSWPPCSTGDAVYYCYSGDPRRVVRSASQFRKSRRRPSMDVLASLG